MIKAIKGLIIKKNKNKNKNTDKKQKQNPKADSDFNERTLTTLVNIINNDNQQAILREEKG